MLDIQLIRESPEKVKEGIVKKQFDPSLVDRVLEKDRQRVELLQRVESLRGERNKISRTQLPEDQTRGKDIKGELKGLESKLRTLDEEFASLLRGLPNLPAEDIPEGKSEKDNKVVSTWGAIPEFGFIPKDHVILGKSLDVLDFETGAKVAGSGFYYLKNDGVLLEMALVQCGIQFLIKKGYTPFITPDLAKEEFYLGTGYLPKGPEAQTYTIAGSDLGLIATAEVTLAGVHAGEILNEKDLPKKYGGYSHCFRVEGGSYGKYSKGLYRVHQFTKVEMFAYSTPEDSNKIHQEFLSLEEEFWQSLGISYRVVEMCTGDLGAQAAKKFDLEAWMPGRATQAGRASPRGQGEYGEVTSTSNTTDYQARNLGIKYRKGGSTEFVHNLNGTLVATSRAIIAILENFQQADGSVVIPEVLRPWMGKEKITPR